MPFGKAAPPFQHSPLLLVPALDADNDLDWDFATSTDIAALNDREFRSRPSVPGPSGPARSKTPERQTSPAQEPATPGNSSSPVVNNTPYVKSAGSHTVTGELPAGSGAQFQPLQTAEEGERIRNDVGVVYDLVDEDFFRLVFNYDPDDQLDAWGLPNDPHSKRTTLQGREVDTYLLFIELCNCISDYLLEHPQLFTSYPDAPHFELIDIPADYGDNTPFANIRPRQHKRPYLKCFETQLMGCALEIFDNGVLRNHVISFLVAPTEFSIIYTDRSVALRTTSGLEVLPIVIHAILKMDRISWGYMPSTSGNPISRNRVVVSSGTSSLNPECFRGCQFSSPEDPSQSLFDMEQVLFSARTVKGRGTKVLIVKPRSGLGKAVLSHIECWVMSQRSLKAVWLARVSKARADRGERLAKVALQAPKEMKSLMAERLSAARKRRLGIPAPAPSPATSAQQLFSLKPEGAKSTRPDGLPTIGSGMTLRSQTSAINALPSPSAPTILDAAPTTEAEEATNSRPHDQYVANIVSSLDFSVTERVGHVIAKISSILDHRQKEFKIVRELRSIASQEGSSYGDHLPLFFDHRTIKFDSSTPQARIHLWAQQAGIPYEMRHVEVLVQDLRYPKTQIHDVYEMAAAYRDILELLVWLKDQKVHHRDISLYNCQFRLVPPHDKHNNRRTVGVLSDFDRAVKYTEAGHSPTADFRTGTLPFMAMEMLDPPNPEHSPHFHRHDIESLYYVIVYHFRTFHKDGGLNFKQPLADWFKSDRNSLVFGKFFELLARGIDSSEEELLPEYRHLFSALDAIRLHVDNAVDKVWPKNRGIKDLETVDGHFDNAEVQRLFGNFVDAAAASV